MGQIKPECIIWNACLFLVYVIIVILTAIEKCDCDVNSEHLCELGISLKNYASKTGVFTSSLHPPFLHSPNLERILTVVLNKIQFYILVFCCG